MYEQALTYLTVDGYSIIPVGLDKRPLVPSWKKYQTQKPTVEEVTEWFKKWPNANIGIVTGKVSGITVVDIDVYKKDHTPITAFPETRTVQTGNGGYHLIYQYQEGLTISANAYPDLPGVDIRSDGGFIVAAGSTTRYLKDGAEVGGPYKVLKDLPLAPFPAHLFGSTKPKKALSDTIAVSNGKRNDSIASVIGKFLVANPERVWYSEVLPAIEKINETYKPPLDLHELRLTFDSIARLEQARRDGVKAPEEDSKPKITADDVRQMFAKDKVKGTYDMAQYLIQKYDIITIGEKEREIFVYENGKYFQAENEIIFPEIQRVLGNMVTKNAKTETYHKVCDATAKPRSIFASAPLNFIPVRNGVYDTETNTLLPHSPKYKFTYQLPVIYDPNATCPKTSAFLDQILDEEQRLTVEEWLGYYLHRNYMFKKAIIFVGEGDTGKTTLLEVIDFMLGKQNISNVSLQKMTSDKFAAAHMFEKHGNLVDELSARDISDTGNFKIATGGGSISGEYKFGNQFSFNNFSKLTFACNKIPDVQDFSDAAYFNRWIVIRFEKTIEKKIPNFIKTLATEEERSGLFNLALKGLERLLEQGRFTYSKTAMDTKREMLRSGSSIANFAAEGIAQELGNEISKEEMYDHYTDFCARKNMASETIKMLGTKLGFYAPFISEGQMNSLNKIGRPERVRCWRNAKLLKIEDEIEDDDF